MQLILIYIMYVHALCVVLVLYSVCFLQLFVTLTLAQSSMLHDLMCLNSSTCGLHLSKHYWQHGGFWPTQHTSLSSRSQVCVWIRDGAEGCERWMGRYLQPNLVLLSCLFVSTKDCCRPLTFLNPDSALTQIVAVIRRAKSHLLFVSLLCFPHSHFFSALSPWLDQ